MRILIIGAGNAGRHLAAKLCDLNHDGQSIAAPNPVVTDVDADGIGDAAFTATDDDLGTRGDAPSHPQLLDWLAVRFMDNEWSVKTLVREIVTSQTYQLSSDHDEAKLLVALQRGGEGRGRREQAFLQ